MNTFKKTTLFCIPFAGGSSYSYQEFQRYANGALNITAVDLPGRGRRFSEPLLTSLNAMADDVFDQIQSRLNGAYAIYGHSMGACIAYLVVRRIIRTGCRLPRHLFVSGRQCPSAPAKEKNWHMLSREDFKEILTHFNGTSREVVENRELMELFEPVLRADFQALADFTYEWNAPFPVPITVMRGSHDNVTRADALRWRDETTRAFSLLEFNGDHFFIFQHAAQIVRIFFRKILTPSDTVICSGGSCSTGR